MTNNKIHYSWIILFTAVLVVFSALGLARFGYSTVLPAMQAGLGMDNTQAGLLASANLLGYLLISVIGGALASRYGGRLVIAIGLAIVGTGMLLTGSAQGFMSAACWRLVTGMGSGGANVVAMGMLSAWFTEKKRGFAAGIGVTGSSLALIALGPIVPWILGSFPGSGWRLCWIGFGCVSILIAILAVIVIRNRPADIGLEPYGPKVAGGKAASGGTSVNWKDVYGSWRVWHLGLVYIAFGFSYIIYMTFFVKYLVTEAGYTKAAAGNVFMIMGWASLLCGLLWGALSDKIGRKNTLIIIYLIQAASFSLFALWHEPAGFIISAILFGLTAWSIPAIMAAACGDVVGPTMAPAALGFITLFFGIGQALGPMVAGMLADVHHSFGSSFLLASAMAIIGAIASGFLPKRKQT